MITDTYKRNLSLFSDLYAWTMAASWFDNGKHIDDSHFVLYFRKLPKDWEFLVFSGIYDIIEFVQNFNMKFAAEELSKLKEVKFKKEFLNFLENFEIKNSNLKIKSVRDGEIIFPYEPVITFTGPLFLLQLFEAFITNTIDYQTRIATKSARISKSLDFEKPWLEFGARRASGIDGSISAVRASMIGGAAGTSNVEAARRLGVNVSGTVGHSFITSFETEKEAFEGFLNTFPQNSSLLIDTYDIPNSLKIIKELNQSGKTINSVRIDSGDLLETSKMTRKFLDQNEMKNTKIIVSGELDEYEISKLEKNRAPIDIYGIGNKLNNIDAIGFVYKLTRLKEKGNWKEVYKKSKNEPEKQTLTGNVEFFRFLENAKPIFDVTTDNKDISGNFEIVNPNTLETPRVSTENLERQEMLRPVYDENAIFHRESLNDIFTRVETTLSKIDLEYTYGIEGDYYKKWKEIN